jgi:hypothetical protein
LSNKGSLTRKIPYHGSVRVWIGRVSMFYVWDLKCFKMIKHVKKW